VEETTIEASRIYICIWINLSLIYSKPYREQKYLLLDRQLERTFNKIIADIRRCDNHKKAPIRYISNRVYLGKEINLNQGGALWNYTRVLIYIQATVS